MSSGTYQGRTWMWLMQIILDFCITISAESFLGFALNAWKNVRHIPQHGGLSLMYYGRK